jgi:hypothetical protein
MMIDSEYSKVHVIGYPESFGPHRGSFAEGKATLRGSRFSQCIGQSERGVLVQVSACHNYQLATTLTCSRHSANYTSTLSQYIQLAESWTFDKECFVRPSDPNAS